MAVPEVVLALVAQSAAHGYDLKRRHDRWFPDARPLAFGQVYATLARLQRDGLVEAVETSSGGGPERTAYAVTDAGRQRLAAWLAEPAEPAHGGADEIVRKTVAAWRTGADIGAFLARQRTAHLRRMRELTGSGPPDADPAALLARDHALAHLDADLRWLDLAVERVRDTTTEETS